VATHGDTAAVAAGAVALVVAGTFVAPYEIGVAPGWNTAKWVLPADKLATQFIVNFSQPPPVNTSLDWSVLDAA